MPKMPRKRSLRIVCAAASIALLSGCGAGSKDSGSATGNEKAVEATAEGGKELSTVSVSLTAGPKVLTWVVSGTGTGNSVLELLHSRPGDTGSHLTTLYRQGPGQTEEKVSIPETSRYELRVVSSGPWRLMIRKADAAKP